MMVVSCDYDFGAPAALAAEGDGMISFFLCAEDVKEGIQGVGPNSFSSSVLAPVQGSIYGDDPRPEVEALNAAYEAKTGARPASQLYPD